MWMFAGLFSILVITSAAAQSCPANQIASDAQIVLYEAGVVSETTERRLSVNPFDTNLTFFSEVLGYSDDEIQQETRNALHFFSERFGLEFSLTQPNELGLRFFQNATLQPIRSRRLMYATFNRWIVTGNTKSKCFLSLIGGYMVTFSGEQVLKGTYGGAEGIDIPSNRIVAYLYVSISIPPCPPVVIQLQSPMPNEDRGSRQIGISVFFYETSHRTLGQGAAQGLVQAENATTANGARFIRLSTVIVLTFPPNVLTFD